MPDKLAAVRRITAQFHRIEAAIDAGYELGYVMHVLVPAVGFYIHHAWVWHHNPAGMFADWNPEVTCP